MSIISSATRTIATALLMLGLAAPLGAAQATEHAGKPGVVIQVSDNNPAVWNLALNNAENIQEALGKDNVNIEIVAYGPGLNMLKFDSEVAPRLKKAEANGVGLMACGTTMKKTHVTEKDLASGVKVVPGGVIEIMNKQREGWAYIKP
jgi:intracellular sulfur oxidation DsrE/DsrF family protein